MYRCLKVIPSFRQVCDLGRGLSAGLLSADLRVARRAAETAQGPAPKAPAIAIARRGDFRIYPLLRVIVLAILGKPCMKMFICASVTASLPHMICPFVKKGFGRRRPFQIAPELACLPEPRDALAGALMASASAIPSRSASRVCGVERAGT